MRTRALLLTIAGAMLGLSPARAQVIVVHSAAKIAEISRSDLRDIFIGASTSFRDGSRAIPVTLKDGPVHEEFLKNYLGRSNTAFLALWRALLFAGHGTMPQAFDTEAMLIDHVASAPGTIGYIGVSTKYEKVKALVVK